MWQYFGVRGAAKRVAAGFQIGAELTIVVNLAVKNYRDGVIFVEGRLLARNEIDDCQPSHPEPDAIIDQVAFRIRPSMRHAIAHRAQQFFRAVMWRRAWIEIGPSGYSAHGSINHRGHRGHKGRHNNS